MFSDQVPALALRQLWTLLTLSLYEETLLEEENTKEKVGGKE